MSGGRDRDGDSARPPDSRSSDVNLRLAGALVALAAGAAAWVIVLLLLRDVVG